MRKYNSSFKTAFLSEPGSEIKNNDYFAYVELDNYACYVVADGITDMRGSESAKEAIHCLIGEFQSSPSLSRSALKRYMKAANRELLKKNSYEKLKASITVVVTDYEKMCFAHAGNTRLRLYREGSRIHSSTDMSLSHDMVIEGQIPKDALAAHEERNNLYAYLGQDHFEPFISPKIRLKDADIVTLYTRGIWENVDEGELSEIFREAGNEPKECCDQIEDLLLSRQPGKVENYTFVAIFVDKVFNDPKRRKRIKKIIIICVIVVAAILVVGIVLFVIFKVRERTREEMDLSYQDMTEYIAGNNFVRAEEECKEADELAGKLYDREMREYLSDYQKFLEAMIAADAIYEDGEYIEAEEGYLNAQVRSRYVDNASAEYLEKRLAQISRYRDVYDNIALGDRLLELAEYELAEEKYIAAKDDAAAVYFESGKEQALAAMEKLYEEWSAAHEEETAAAVEQAAEQVSAAELVSQGDGAYAGGDYDGAMVFYLIALEKYTKLEDAAQIEVLNQKIIALNEKQADVKARAAEAKQFEEQAQLYIEEGQYDAAKEQYQYAKNIYREMGKDSQVDEVQGKIDVVDTKVKQQEKEQAEKDEVKETVSGNGG